MEDFPFVREIVMVLLGLYAVTVSLDLVFLF